jgi:hypothetical protein
MAAIWGNVLPGLSGLFGDDGSDAASEYYKQLAGRYKAVNPEITAQTVGPTEMGKTDPATRAAQMDALRELQTQYSKGGLDAIGKSQVAEANQSTNRNAQAQANSIQQRARSQGQGNSGVTAALQEQAGQDAAERGSQQTMAAAAGAQQRQQGAVKSAGELAGGVREQDYQPAAAQDAINRYNAGMKYSAQQDTFGNRMQALGGEGAAYGGGYAAQRYGDARKRQAWADFGAGNDEAAKEVKSGVMSYLGGMGG